jgi:hypothetical protein
MRPQPGGAGTETVTGRFAGKTFEGRSEGPNCGYKVTLQRAGWYRPGRRVDVGRTAGALLVIETFAWVKYRRA